MHPPEPDEETADLRRQVEELRATLAAIRSGDVDGVLLHDQGDARLYARTNADRPYRVLVEEMGEGAATISERGVILYANRRLCTLLGRSAAELVGTDVSAVVHAAEGWALAALLCAGPTQTNRAELTLARPDATPVRVMTSATGLDIDGVLVRCLIVSDLTERRRQDRLLAHANDAVAEHSAGLERANAELLRSNEEFSQFAFVAGHDLAEPLRSIGGFARLVARRHKGRLDAETDEYLDFITSGVERMQGLIDDLLGYSRVDSRARPLVPVDANAVLANVLVDLSGRIGELGALVEVDDLPIVNADSGQLAQVFANLLRNGLNFVAPGVTPRVHVSARQVESGWAFVVADNGIGIPMAQRTRIFAMFARLHSREDYPGTGIGLAIVEKVLRRHGGRIWVEDNPDGGTRMCFTMPRLVPAQAATGSPAGLVASVNTNLR